MLLNYFVSVTALSDCEKAVVKIYNEKRPLHAATEVIVDPQLSREAQKYAEQLKKEKIPDTSPFEKPGIGVEITCDTFSGW